VVGVICHLGRRPSPLSATAWAVVPALVVRRFGLRFRRDRESVSFGSNASFARTPGRLHPLLLAYYVLFRRGVASHPPTATM
jgi:hypothetical protein